MHIAAQQWGQQWSVWFLICLRLEKKKKKSGPVSHRTCSSLRDNEAPLYQGVFICSLPFISTFLAAPADDRSGEDVIQPQLHCAISSVIRFFFAPSHSRKDDSFYKGPPSHLILPLSSFNFNVKHFCGTAAISLTVTEPFLFTCSTVTAVILFPNPFLFEAKLAKKRLQLHGVDVPGFRMFCFLVL